MKVSRVAASNFSHGMKILFYDFASPAAEKQNNPSICLSWALNISSRGPTEKGGPALIRKA
jgi:hypothetical protein